MGTWMIIVPSNIYSLKFEILEISRKKKLKFMFNNWIDFSTKNIKIFTSTHLQIKIIDYNNVRIHKSKILYF